MKTTGRPVGHEVPDKLHCPGCSELLAITHNPDDTLEDHAMHCTKVLIRPDLAPLAERATSRRRRREARDKATAAAPTTTRPERPERSERRR